METRTAFSPAFVDVNNALNGVGTPTGGTVYTTPLIDSDTLNIPSGTANWGTSRLVTTSLVKILGSGMATTEITSFYSFNGSPASLRGAIAFLVTEGSQEFTWGPSGFTMHFQGALGQALFVSGDSSTADPVLGTSAGFRMSDAKLLNEGASGGPMMRFNDVIGVVDHCYFDSGEDADQWCDVYNINWRGNQNAHGGFIDPVRWGTIEFLYFEDCYIKYGGMDAHDAARYVVRHCRLPNNARPLDHGTESHTHGIRAKEIYNNWFSETPGSGIAETRSGTDIVHDNIISGSNTYHYRLHTHRLHGRKNNGSVRGENPEYILITDAISPPCDQHTALSDPAALPSISNEPLNGNVSIDEDTGTVTADMLVGDIVMTDSTAAWAVNQWRTFNPNILDSTLGYTYQLVNTDDPEMSCANISSNTATTLTVDINGLPEDIHFTTGQHYAIRKIFAAEDQPGMGCIEMTDAQANATGSVARVSNQNAQTGTCTVGNVNTTTGVKTIGWMNQKLDPNYGWNNWTGPNFGDGIELGFKPTEGVYLLNRDYFNRQKPEPGYGLETGTYGALISEVYSPGYPVISSPTPEMQQVGAKGITGMDDADILHPDTITDVSGFVYPHPYVEPITVEPPPTVTYLPGVWGGFGSSGTIDPNLVNNMGIVGILVSRNWSEIEKVPGVYDFSLLDDDIQEALDAGFDHLNVVVTNSTNDLPAWLRTELANKPVITQLGTPGATTYTYQIVGKAGATQKGSGNPVATLTGAATLNATDKNHLVWVAQDGATSYDVYRTTSGGTPSSVGLIANTAALTLDDTGLAGNGATAPAADGTIFLRDPGQNHSTFCDPIDTPLYWNTRFQSKRLAMITAMGAHYTDLPYVHGVFASFCNHNSMDWNVQDTRGELSGTGCTGGPYVVDQPAQWVAGGWTRAKVLQVGKDTLDTVAAAFPNQAIKLPIGGLDDALANFSCPAVVTSGSATVTSATAAFTGADLHSPISANNALDGTAIGDNRYIGIVNSSTSIGISSSATANVPVAAVDDATYLNIHARTPDPRDPTSAYYATMAYEMTQYIATRPFADRVFITRNTVSAAWGPPPDTEPNIGAKEQYIKWMIAQASPNSGLQSVSKATGTSTDSPPYRQGGEGPGGPTYCVGVTKEECEFDIMQNTLQVGLDYGVPFFEVWPQDSKNPAFYDLIRQTTIAMGGTPRDQAMQPPPEDVIIGSPPDDPGVILHGTILRPDPVQFPYPRPGLVGTTASGFQNNGSGPLIGPGQPLSLLCDTYGFICMFFQIRLENPLPGQTTDGTYPQQTDDYSIGVRYMRSLGDCNGFVAGVGGSGSAHHCLYKCLVGVAGDDRLDACIAMSPPTNFADREDDVFTFPNVIPNLEMYGGTTDLPTLLAQSPVSKVTALAPPMYFSNGHPDKGMPYSMFTQFLQACVDAGLTNYMGQVNTTHEHSFKSWFEVQNTAIPFLLAAADAWSGGGGNPLPVISSFTPTEAHVNDHVIISGFHLNGTSSVKINGTEAVFFVAGDTSIDATVSIGTTSGFITVTTPIGTATSSQSLTILEDGIQVLLLRTPILIYPVGGVPPASPTKPGPVTNLIVEASGIAGDRTATATWNPPVDTGGATLLPYRASLTGGSGSIPIIPGNAMGCTITALDSPGTLYRFHIWAETVYGESEEDFFDFTSNTGGGGGGGSVKDEPRGCVAVFDAPGGVPVFKVVDVPGFWDASPFILGTKFVTRWNVIQSTDDLLVFDWQPIDDYLALCTTYDKFAGIQIQMGIYTPTILKSHLALFTVSGPDAGTMPPPGGRSYVDAIGNFWNVFCKRYDAHPKLLYVVLSGMGQAGDTLVVEAADVDALTTLIVNNPNTDYTNIVDAWMYNNNRLLGMSNNGLQHTHFMFNLELPVPVGTAIKDGDDGINELNLAALGLAYQTRIGLMTTDLTGASDATNNINFIIRAQSDLPIAAGFGFKYPSTEPLCDPTQSGTYDPELGLRHTIQAGAGALNGKFLELFFEDASNTDADYQTDFSDANDLMAGNP